MTTARDLMITAIAAEPEHPVPHGELSLALAGAELLDLLADETVVLDGDRIVPRLRVPNADPLLEQAAAALVDSPPYESVEDWLWRRGRDLASAYLAAFEQDGQLTRQRHRMPFRSGNVTLADTPERRAAEERRTAGEPVLAGLAAAAGVRDAGAGAVGDAAGAAGAVVEPVADGVVPRDPVDIVLAAVGDAATELKAVRQRRDIEQAAYDNIWRGV
ncbi:MAG: GPP34 family phosphoprotein [Streptomycetaceae bacterium]|nr:GPP34 family phosphoprotein [Streptomycetaceae bacterium]